MPSSPRNLSLSSRPSSTRISTIRPPAVGTGVLPHLAHTDRRSFAWLSLHHRIAGIEVKLHPLPFLIKGPAAALGVDGWVHIEILSPWARMFLQLQKRFQRPVISLHGKAAHQLRRFAGILRRKQDVDQAVPHILRGVIIKLTG